ncbi:MAG: PIN domain-containing protein [Nitrospinae bacterium]|nr:PIN domain-containing protein [Nitrospinota bacterium]
MTLRVYLDTAVFSAYYDDRAPDRRHQTEEFWARRGDYELATSELARDELAQTPDPARRAQLQALLADVTIYPLSDDIRQLARQYLEAGVFTRTMLNDALHVATAVLTRHDSLLSWNFRHLVNRRRRARIHDVNTTLGLPT